MRKPAVFVASHIPARMADLWLAHSLCDLDPFMWVGIDEASACDQHADNQSEAPIDWLPPAVTVSVSG